MSTPRADVWVDGASLGMSPVDVALAQGEHVIRVRLGGFEAQESPVTIASGDAKELAVELVLLDAEEREGLQLLADAALPKDDRLWVQTFEEQPPSRGDGDGKQVRILFPRGSVRPADVRGFRIEFAAGAQQEGAVEFRRGDKLLHRFVVKPDAGRSVDGDIPASVRKLLTSGDQVRWGFYPAKGAPRTAQFKVVDLNLQQAMSAIGEAFEGQPKAAAAHIRSQLLLNKGLYYAAYQEARDVLKTEKGSVRAWAVILEALKKMGVSQATRTWREAQKALAGAPKKLKQQVRYLPASSLRRVGAHLASGDAGRALSTLRKQLKGGGTPGPLQLQDLAESTASNAGAMGQKAPGAGGKFVVELRDLITKAQEGKGDAGTLRWATAHLYIAEGRLQAGSGGKPGPDFWLKAVAEIAPALEGQPEADAAPGYAQAVRWLHEAAALPGIDAKPVMARASELAETLSLRFPKRPEAALATASTQFLRVRVEPKMRRKDVREALTVGVDALQPHLAAKTPEPSVGTLYTRAVTIAKARKLGLKLDYRSVEAQGERNFVKFNIPLSEEWLVSNDPLGRYLVFIRNLDEAGALQRVVTISSFDWYVPYRFRNGRETSGENVGALSKSGLDETLTRFGKVKKKRKSRVRKLSRRFTRAYHYDVQGETRDGAFLRVRSWILKSKEHKISYQVTVQSLVKGLPTTDPALSFVLDSIRDVER